MQYFTMCHQLTEIFHLNIQDADVGVTNRHGCQPGSGSWSRGCYASGFRVVDKLSASLCLHGTYLKAFVETFSVEVSALTIMLDGRVV